MRLLLLIFYILIGVQTNAQETKTSIGLVLSPHFSSQRYFISGSASESSLEKAKSSTIGQIGLSGSVFFQYELTKKLFVTWGLGVQNYRHKREILFAGGAGYYSLRTHSQHYLQLNTSIKYRIIKTFYARAGIGVDILAEARYKIYSNSSSGGFAYVGDDIANFKEAMVPVQLGFGYELKLTDRWNLMTELYGTTVVTGAIDISEDTSNLQRKPWQLGFNIGFIRSF